MTEGNIVLAHGVNRLRGAQHRVASAEHRVGRARAEVLRLSGADRAERVAAVLAAEDAEAELQRARDQVGEAEAELSRLRDEAQAARLERAQVELWQAALAVDAAMVELTAAFSHHRETMLAVARLSPSIARAVMGPHQRRMVARGAAQCHGLEPFLALERVMPAAAKPFASVECPALEAEITRLRGATGSEAAPVAGEEAA